MPNAAVVSSDHLEREISRAVVAIYKEYIGRGSTLARTTITDDMVVCVLHDSLTKAEQTLIASDGPETVRLLRRKFQDAMQADIRKAVEQALDRRTTAMLSDHITDPDVAVEIVMLEPL
jgi:uncharacterized protein YbcI